MRWLDGITDSMDVSEQALGVGDGQGSLVCCSPRGRTEWDTTDQITTEDDSPRELFRTQP